jgi:hypothetical protein
VAKKLHHHPRPKVETLVGVLTAGNQDGAASQLEMVILGLETEMDIKGTDIKMVVGTPLLRLMAVTETVYRLLRQ